MIKFIHNLKFNVSIVISGPSSTKKTDDDLQILQEIPGKSTLPGINSLSSLLGTVGGSGAASGGAGAFFNTPNILQAQDPFFNLASMQAGGSSSTNTLDILQKCKFNFVLIDHDMKNQQVCSKKFFHYLEFTGIHVKFGILEIF